MALLGGLGFEGAQLLHRVEIVLFREKHLCARLVHALPDFGRLLDQNSIRGTVMLAIKIGWLNELFKEKVGARPDIFGQIKHNLRKVVYRHAHSVEDVILIGRG